MALRVTTTYQHPDAEFSETFQLDHDGELLGECGANLAFYDDVGVWALEVWVYDHTEVSQYSMIFLTLFGFFNPVFKNQAEQRGEVYVANEGAVAEIETETLRFTVSLLDIEYLEPEGEPAIHIERAMFELYVEWIG